jgi:hypothetical protein
MLLLSIESSSRELTSKSSGPRRPPRAAWILARISSEIRLGVKPWCRPHADVDPRAATTFWGIHCLRGKTAASNADCSAVSRSSYEVTGGVDEWQRCGTPGRWREGSGGLRVEGEVCLRADGAKLPLLVALHSKFGALDVLVGMVATVVPRG